MQDSFYPDQAADSDAVALQHLQNCCHEIKAELSSNKPKLNDGKSEATLHGSKTQRLEALLQYLCWKLGDSEISFSASIRGFGLVLEWVSLCMITSVQHLGLADFSSTLFGSCNLV